MDRQLQKFISLQYFLTNRFIKQQPRIASYSTHLAINQICDHFKKDWSPFRILHVGIIFDSQYLGYT